MTKLQAIERTLDTWHHNLQCAELIPHCSNPGLINYHLGSCALCRKYLYEDSLCGTCPLYWLQGEVSCQDEDSPYQEWQEALYDPKGSGVLKATLNMLDLIETLYWEEVKVYE